MAAIAYGELESYAEARAAFDRGDGSDAELACAYVASHVRARGGSRWIQGARRAALGDANASAAMGGALSPRARLFAEMRLLRVEDAAARGLVAWARGARDVDLLFDVPHARAVLALQARGRRCVSLLDDDTRAAPHADGLAFALHDLCHLEKFVDPASHAAQVGFFASIDAAIDGDAWAALGARFDDAWLRDCEHVVADMNGSPVFLFAALKMKLKMASRRALARSRGVPAKEAGALDAGEARAYDESLSALLDVLGLEGETRDAAARVDATRAHREDARVLVAHYERAGRAVLG